MAGFPLGARGERPVLFSCDIPWEDLRSILEIPGVERMRGGVRCGWDAAWAVAALLRASAPTPKLPTPEDALALPGLARFRRLGLSEKLRSYQKTGALFLAWRAWAMNCDPMRSGKSVQSLAASVLVDSQKTLIVCPALAKLVWAEEVAKWLDESAIILEGRAGNIARRFCLACGGRGGLKNGVRCDSCKKRNGQATGYRIFDVGDLEPELSYRLEDYEGRKKGAPRKRVYYANLPPTFRCAKHPDMISNLAGQSCPACRDELLAAIDRARYVIVNYDLLSPQKSSDAAGKGYTREDLQGWAPILARFNFDLCIADESHLLRGFSTSQKKKGTSRRERFNQVTLPIPRVWGLTGTPVYGYVRDLWGQLDSISGGLYSRDDRLPFSFHTRYCDGRRGEFGWVADGRTAYADSELKRRMELFKIQRARSEILKDMPPKIRQVIHIDGSDKVQQVSSSSVSGGRQSLLTRHLRKTAEVKRPIVVEHVVKTLAEGQKAVVFTLHRKSAEKLAKALEKECRKREHKARMKQVEPRVWLAHGEASPAARHDAARSFREWYGAAAFVTTIDAVQVAISLKGATSVHFADLHWMPAALLQAEDRPYEVGTSGLEIVYYVVSNSVDEHIEAIVLPKVETLAKMVDEQGADSIWDALTAEDKADTLDDLWDRMTAHLDNPDYRNEEDEEDEYDPAFAMELPE